MIFTAKPLPPTLVSSAFNTARKTIHKATKRCLQLGLQAGLPLAAAITMQSCSTTSQQNPNATQNSEAPAAQASTNKPANVIKVIDRSFSIETLYALMVAEFAIDRKRYDIALGNYVQQAVNTEELNITVRATQIARILKARQATLEMSQLWLSINPASEDAMMIAANELIEANQLLKAFEVSKSLKSTLGKASFDTIAMQAESSDAKTVNYLIEELQELSTLYPKDASIWVGLSVLLQSEGQLEQALNAAEQAKLLDDDSIQSVFQEARVLQQMGKQDLARERLQNLVNAHPLNTSLRVRYARVISRYDLDESAVQFGILHKQLPGDGEILYSLALIEKNRGLFDRAIQHFNELISNGQHIDSAHFHLGDIYQKTKVPEKAIKHFGEIKTGQHYIAAVAKMTEILISENNREQALALIKQEMQRPNTSNLEKLYMLEADTLSRAGQMSAAESSLSQGLKTFPNSTTLLYSRAMLYVRLDYISAAEQDLKRVIEITPKNAAALNALGYTLADRTDRLDEARSYIEQAYALTPNDPAVLDSLGWVAFRQGNFEDSIEKLNRAIAAMPDHEIAAHLGEVLWVSGRQREAITIWKDGLKLNPNSKIIHQAIHRLEAKLD
ncbi:MAG: hypothetical protein COA42_03740 [Alteromonadaceae bacterium]|nr:MAG: hypothetical protein COA42_03740 [Alteromonadaceae bacterium]